MAETIRYDTSDDPVTAQAIAEKEAESLKIGEELIAVSYTHLTLPTTPYV